MVAKCGGSTPLHAHAPPTTQHTDIADSAIAYPLLVCAASLQLHAAVDLRAPGVAQGAAVARPVTSLLWVGPALLALAADGRVIQVGGGVHGVLAWGACFRPCLVQYAHTLEFLSPITPGHL